MTDPFHLAFTVKDIESTKAFYHDILGCALGRETDTWVDFNFFGHQLSAHVSASRPLLDYCGRVDGIPVPIPHFGCLLAPEDFDRISERLKAAGIGCIVPPNTRYAGQPGEQRTLFVLDFSDNALEFKSFTNRDEVFALQ